MVHSIRAAQDEGAVKRRTRVQQFAGGRLHHRLNICGIELRDYLALCQVRRNCVA
jgi:hypothetical protein